LYFAVQFTHGDRVYYSPEIIRDALAQHKTFGLQILLALLLEKRRLISSQGIRYPIYRLGKLNCAELSSLLTFTK